VSPVDHRHNFICALSHRDRRRLKIGIMCSCQYRSHHLECFYIVSSLSKSKPMPFILSRPTWYCCVLKTKKVIKSRVGCESRVSRILRSSQKKNGVRDDDVMFESCRRLSQTLPYFINNNNNSNIMFFFFVGGVEPTVKRTIQTAVAPCPNCHDGNLDRVEMAKTFKAFFIPVWTFGDSREVLRCNKCKCMVSAHARQVLQQSRGGGVCSCCGSALQPGWHFCPACGVDSSTVQGTVATGVPVGKN